MFTTIINVSEVQKAYNLPEEVVGGMQILYAAENEEMGYTFFKQDGKLYENIGTEWTPSEVTVFSMVKNLSTNPEIQDLYFALPDFIGFLKNLQMSEKSVVEELIGEAKSFSPEQLQEWMSKRSDAELEELGSFGATVVNFAKGELENRYGATEEYDEYDDEE